MAVVNIKIRTAWWYRGHEDRIDFMVEREDGAERHIWVPADTALGQFLKEDLAARGYTGPKSEKPTE